jgi:serine/threonine-protein kinase 24/25/MST4
MRVLFLIPKEPPPQLEGPFSSALRDFVAACLQRDPAARPTARELLSHPFLAAASRPPELAAVVAQHALRRQPLPARRHAGQS